MALDQSEYVTRFQQIFENLHAAIPDLPEAVTTPQLLDAAAARELVSRAEVDLVLDAWRPLRYGSSLPPEATLESGLSNLTQIAAVFADLSEDARIQLASAFEAQSAPIEWKPPRRFQWREAADTVETSPDPAEHQSNVDTDLDIETDADVDQEPAQPPRKFFSIPNVLVFFMIWSSIMVILGAVYHRQLHETGLFYYYMFLGLEEDPAASLIEARQFARENPNDPGIWPNLGRRFEQLNDYAESIAAFERGISLAPNNPEMLNSYAWMLCTAEDEIYRDPIRALRLAEAAYELNPAAHITDTYAEAAYQNGLYQRALELGAEAFDKAQNNQNYYKRQLKKFTKAAEEDEAARGRAT